MHKSHTPASTIPARTVYRLSDSDLKTACRNYLTGLGEELPLGNEFVWGLDHSHDFCFVVDGNVPDENDV